MIRFYNTLSKQKEDFEPVKPGKAGIYLCGPTVYKPSHIGHMVGPVIFDSIKRYLTFSGYEVNFVINITDVDDKLIAEAATRKMSMAAVADEMTADYKANLEALGVDSVNEFPKCTDHIGDIIAMIERLIEKGHAYASEGDVYFEVSSYQDYGKLSNRPVDEMQGEGGDTVSRKKSPTDFALWKSAKEGEPAWDSPWGQGRPGWHIECSAMSQAVLGEQFDIHGGGLDLIFPHHENEVAQSECANGLPMAKYWLHNGLMQASSELGKLGGRNTREAGEDDSDTASQEAGKISKSKGSSAFKDLLEKFPAETIRFFLLSTHYRRPIDYSEERLAEVQKGLDTFYRYFQRFEKVTGVSFYQLKYLATREACDAFTQDVVLGEIAVQLNEALGESDVNAPNFTTETVALRKKLLEALDDDFNTGAGIGVLYDYLRLLNKFIDEHKLEDSAALDPEKKEAFFSALVGATTYFRAFSSFFGLFRQPPETKDDGAGGELVGDLMELLIEIRQNARKNKDFATADIVRDKLDALGIVLEDRPGGTEWSKK